ncbi:glycosyltransferase [Pseudomonadota bacterium]
MSALTTEDLPSCVVFFNEASSVIGMGHILRSQVLARSMHLRGWKIAGVTIGDEKAVTFAQGRCKENGFAWPIELFANANAAIEHIRQYQNVVVVMDCTNYGRELVYTCKQSGLPVLALDYFDASPPLPQAVVSLIDHNPDSVAGNPPAREGVLYKEGPENAIIRDEFVVARLERMGRDEPETLLKVLIAFGGADPSGNTKRAIEIVAAWPGNFDIDVIIGVLFAPEIEAVVNNVQGDNRIRIHVSPSDMGRLFQGADLIFCGGGGTLLEALCVGVPAIVIAQNEAEWRHAQSLANVGVCWLADCVDWNLVSPIANRKEMSKAARARVDGAGAGRICDCIEQLLNQE